MILSSPVQTSISVTEMNDPINDFIFDSCVLIGRYLIFTLEPDRDISPEEPSSTWIYELTEEQRDKLLSYEPEERSISVEWCWTHVETNERIEDYEYQDLEENEQEQYVPNFDISM